MAKFKRYDSYKNSGVEWLGEIPSHWEILKLKFVSKIETGNSISDDKKSNYECVECKSHPYIATKDINYEYSTINYDNGLRIPKDETNFKIALPDSILICVEGGSAGKKIAYTNQGVCYVNKLASIQTIGENVSKFLYYVIKSHIFKNQFDLSINGLIGGVSVLLIKNFCVILPPKDEQEKIASYLDEKIAKIDASISGKEKFIELLKEQKQIIINDAVTKGLNKNAKFKNSGVEWLGEIPSHWKNIKTTHIFNRIGSGTTPTSTNTKYYDGEINWLQTGDLADDIIYKTSKKITHKALKDFSTLKIYPKNSLVIAMYGATIGKVGILDIETTTNQACCVLSDTKQILEKYAFYWFLASKNNIISLGYGGGQPNISQDLIKSLRITLPPKSEQEKIVEYIETKTAKIDKLVNLEQEYIKSLKEYKASLIDSVVTGKVRIV
ncbi:restriction endonuclease subunit S [Campylobacter concisus]|uniref:restriction endonuclease subunit S n=1 Tax=Campylobacter concisus TaxID=199 RepID=UPI000CD89BF4|nr:restriction endonuclease subunit S [Campylobacter concisus]